MNYYVIEGFETSSVILRKVDGQYYYWNNIRCEWDDYISFDLVGIQSYIEIPINKLTKIRSDNYFKTLVDFNKRNFYKELLE